MPRVKDSFVYYGSFHRSYIRIKAALGAEAACHFYETIAEYGLTGVLPEEDDIVWIQGFEQIIASVAAAKDRYNTAVENGKKGGRPSTIDKERVIELKNQGLTNVKVAETLGCSVSSVEKILSAYRKNQKKLNENVNDNVNENEDGNGFLRLSPQKPENPSPQPMSIDF